MKAFLPWILGLAVLAGAAVVFYIPDVLAQPAAVAAVAGAVIVGVLLLRYETRFYPAVLLAFFWAGTGMPFQSAGTIGRWAMLAAAAVFGVAIAIRRGWMHFEIFHFLTGFAVTMAGASVYDSVNRSLAGPKAASLALLFLYCSVGLRLSFRGRERPFMEWVGATAEGVVWFTVVMYYLVGRPFWGNPNSLGAVMSVVIFPIVLWSTQTARTQMELYRRWAALAIAGYFVYQSGSRASIGSLILSSALLLWGLRRHRLLANGFILLVLLIPTVELLSPGRLGDIVTGVVYKQNGERDLLQSRRSVWNTTMAIIEKRPMLGSGFGTSVASNRLDSGGIALTSRSEEMEHGSSYLSMVAWLGLLGSVPFVLMLLTIGIRLSRAYAWMRSSGNAQHAIVPIAAVITAGLVNAVFEDWLLAVGYYLCIVFWTFTFLLVDLAPSRFAGAEWKWRQSHPLSVAAR